MPARNSQKNYIEDGYYHLYNRGVEKRKIFLDEQDYAVFLSYLKEYLLPKDTDFLQEQLISPTASREEKEKARKALRMNNFSDGITLLAYCLMPNHFHFFLKQTHPNTIDTFMNSLGTRYSMYFNKKYDRVGSLYQDVYKAAQIISETHYLHLSRYIHKQALAISAQGVPLRKQPSSYDEYVGRKKTAWLRPDEILSYFSKSNSHLSYEAFVLEPADEILLPVLEEAH